MSLASITGPSVWIREIEENVRRLLRIRKAALQQKMSVRMIEDMLDINSQTFTVNNLQQLPASLQPECISMRTVSDYLFFFTGDYPLRNWYPSKFVMDDVTYLNGRTIYNEEQGYDL